MSVTRNGVKDSEEHAMVLIKLFCPDWNSSDKSLSEFQFKNSYRSDKVRNIRAGSLFLLKIRKIKKKIYGVSDNFGGSVFLEKMKKSAIIIGNQLYFLLDSL